MTSAQVKGKNSRIRKKKHLDERLTMLYRRAKIIEDELLHLEALEEYYRVCIFGSARIKPEMKAYEDVTWLAEELACHGIDILTGGGPGLMEAANFGAQQGITKVKSKSKSFGISIELEFEPIPNRHLDIKRHHHKFSSRLDDFMRLSHGIIVTPGGVGTLLELFFCWQLVQVQHAVARPIILMGKDYWDGIYEWLKEVPLKRNLISPQDFNPLHIVDTPQEASKIIIDDFRIKQPKSYARMMLALQKNL
jgi:uncharacterized protein (TIGR00730 family)